MEIDQVFRGRERGDDANAGMAESGDDDQEAALIGAADTGDALFAVEGLGIQIEGPQGSLADRRIVIGRYDRDWHHPVKNQIRVQSNCSYIVHRKPAGQSVRKT